MAILKNPNDTVTVAPGVLITIVHKATLSVEGIKHMGNVPGGVDRWLRRGSGYDGVRIHLEEGSVRVDVYVVANAAYNLFEICRQVQDAVTRTIKEYVGMKVLAVNVHIENVVFG